MAAGPRGGMAPAQIAAIFGQVPPAPAALAQAQPQPQGPPQGQPAQPVQQTGQGASAAPTDLGATPVPATPVALPPTPTEQDMADIWNGLFSPDSPDDPCPTQPASEAAVHSHARQASSASLSEEDDQMGRCETLSPVEEEEAPVTRIRTEAARSASTRPSMMRRVRSNLVKTSRARLAERAASAASGASQLDTDASLDSQSQAQSQDQGQGPGHGI